MLCCRQNLIISFYRDSGRALGLAKRKAQRMEQAGDRTSKAITLGQCLWQSLLKLKANGANNQEPQRMD